MKWILLVLSIAATLNTAEASHRRHRRSSTSPAPASLGGDADAMLRVLSAEDRRTKDRYLLSALHHPSRRVVNEAILALGRIGDTSGYEDLERIFNHKDNELKKAAAFALSLMPDDTALKIVVQNIPMQRDPDVLAALYGGLGRLGNEKNVPALAAALNTSTDDRISRAVCESLGILWSGSSEKWDVPPGLLQRLLKLTETPNEDLAIACAFALARYKGDASLVSAPEILEAIGKAPPHSARPLLIRMLSRNRTAPATAELVDQAASSNVLGVRIEAAKALATHPLTDAVQELFKRLLNDDSSSIVVQTLESIAYHGTGAYALSPAVEQVYLKGSNSPWVRGIALKALTTINPLQGHLRVREVTAVANSPLLVWAVAALAIAPTDSELSQLVDYIDGDNVRVAEEAIDGVSTLTEDRFSPGMRVALKRALERGDSALSALVSQIVEKYKWKDFAQSLATVYPLFTQPDDIEAKTAILSALGAVGDHSHVPLLEAAMKDTERSVVATAADALKNITGTDESARVPANSHSTPMAFSTREIRIATNARVMLRTTKGDIELKLMDVAPLTALNFYRLVKKKFYDGKTFHRVVPDFVIQGGDPRGDGYGGPGYLIRDEISPAPHLRGTVGMATAGRDTGGCQFFINTAANLHLDGRYTLFAQVLKGMDVVDKIEVGDRILSASIL
jgi:peptidylprolyl isomerase